MKRNMSILAILVLSLIATYSCKSKETMSAILHNDQGTYDKAIEQAKLAIEKNPNDADAHFELGRSYSYTGDMVGAYEEFQTAARLDPKRVADAETGIKSNWAKHFNAGISEFQTDNLAGAAHEFELTTQSDPRQVKGWLNLAKVYASLAIGDSTYTVREYAAVDTLIAMTKEDSEDYASVLALTGHVMVKRGMKEEALKIFDKLLLDDPANYEEVERAGNDYLVTKDWESGATFLQMAVDARKKTDSEDFESYYNLGVAYFNAKNCPKAVEAYLSAYDIDPENKQGNYSLLLTYYSCEMYDDAILQGQKYTEKWPEDPNAWNVLSRCYGKKGMKIKAEEAMKKAQELSQ
ncbi:MAG: tetratricopeptide repeat protein [Candidatus Krumholzibacteria bacterium]|nr:tetratricopeptide repeat protein [Candidatus Krumholzibacteria bacterium]